MWICAQCGEGNPEDGRFCKRCGAARGEAPTGIRKTVTVLFCDLVGSTSLGDRSEPEVFRDVMSGYHRELRKILEAHGGSVEKFIGDAAMAVFGIPHVQEDDALRATRAAAEILASVGRLGLEVRIGVNTGGVVAGQGETLVIGDAVNVAARLEQAASPGEVLLGETTYRLVRDEVRVKLAGPFALKGKAEPVGAFRLLELLPDVSAFQRPVDASFIGREVELATLEGALTRAIEERSTQIATIVGPPGIGKSRLARELFQRSPARVLVGRCLSYGEGITYWPLAEVLSQVGDIQSALRTENDADLAASRIAMAQGTADATTSPVEIAWGFRKLFEALAREKPLIVALDDIHWAEPTLLDLIEYVANFAHDAPLLLLCLARPDLFERRHGWATPQPNRALITLGPLEEKKVEALVDGLGDVPEELKLRIVETAEGNPLFVEQLVAMQAESGEGALEVPPTIQALLAARIDRLEPEERSVLEHAAVEGRVFHRGSVAALLSDATRPGLGTHLMTLVRKEFIRPDRELFAGDDGFRFCHILIRDAAYDGIAKHRRAELHERFAAWLEQTAGDRVREFDEIVAYHLEQAYRYLEQLGPRDERQRELAIRAGGLLAAAGERAAPRDPAGAQNLLERGMALLPEGHPERPKFLLALAGAARNVGDLGHARAVYERALGEARTAGDERFELRIALGLEILRSVTDPAYRFEGLRQTAERAIPVLERYSDDAGLFQAYRVLWTYYCIDGCRFDASAEAAKRALEHAHKLGDRQRIAAALSDLALSVVFGTTPADVGARRCREMLDEVGDAVVPRASIMIDLAVLEAMRRDFDEARSLSSTSIAMLEELGHTFHAVAVTLEAGQIELLAGDPAGAEQILRRGVETLGATGETMRLSTLAGFLAEALYAQAKYDAAEEAVTMCEQAASPDDLMSQVLARRMRAQLLARRGEFESAELIAHEAVRLVAPSDDITMTADTLAALAEVLRLRGKTTEAAEALHQAIRLQKQKGNAASVGALETTADELRAQTRERS
jgi:class 3 adenylate cyclase/predicted ATPase